MVQSFAAEAGQLDRPPSPPRLADVTHLLARAVESLPHTPNARPLAQQIEAEARAMNPEPNDRALAEHASRSATFALQAIEGMKDPSGSKTDRQRTLDEARRAVSQLGAAAATGGAHSTVGEAYRRVARAMLTATGGPAVSDRDLEGLVARLSIDDPDDARETGAQILYAMAEAFEALRQPGPASSLRQHAETLASAEPLDYAPKLKEALAVAVEAIAAVEKNLRRAALPGLRAQAQAAVERISPQRPFELQRAAAQDALRLITDALAVAATR